MSPPTPLENLSGPSGSLKAEPPDDAEIAGLLRTLRFGGCWTCVTTNAISANTKACWR